MKFKKIMSLLLVLTLIGSLLTTVTLLNPTAEDTEATIPTTNYNTHVIYAQGVSTAAAGRAFFINVPAANVKAGETYTASVTLQGIKPSGDTIRLLVKNGSEGAAAKIGDSNGDTPVGTYSAGWKWTETVTIPQTVAAGGIYIGIRLNKSNFNTADFYLGNVELIDKNGKNVAPKITESTTIYGAAGADHLIQNGEASFWTTLQTKSIDDETDTDLKQTLVNNFYTGDSMLNLKVGTASTVFSVFRKIPASKLKAETTYKLSIKYSGSPAIDEYRYFVIREGNTRTTSSTLGTITRLSGYVDCYEYTAEYKTSATRQDLYIGIHMNGSGWTAANFYIADMQFVEVGTTENVFTPLSDMSNYYRAASANSDAYIEALNSAYYVSIAKQPLDRDKYFEPENKEAAKYILHAKGKSDAAAGLAVYLRIPADKIEANKTYTVSAVLLGHTMDDYNNLAVRQGTAGANANVLAQYTKTGTWKNLSTGYSGANKWTAEVTPTTKTDLYVGLRLQATPIKTSDFYLGDIKVIDENGNNIAPELFPTTTIYRTTHHTTTISTDAALSSYFETIEFIRLDKVADEALKQKLFDNYYNGDSMLNLSVGSANEQHMIYKTIPASKLTGNTKYKLSFKYSNATISGNNCIALRDNTADGSADVFNSASSGQFIDHGNYKEYVNYYTTPTEPVTLYFGIFLDKTTWSTAQLYIGDIQMVDADGKNYTTPLSDTSDLYSGYKGRSITNKYTSSNTVVKLKKQVLDTEKFSDPVSTDKKMVNFSYTEGTNGCKVFVKLPHTLAGDYKLSVKTKGLNFTDYSKVAVRKRTPLSSDSTTGITLSQVAQPSLDEGTYTFTTDDFSELYVGFDLNPTMTTNMNFYVEKLELVRMENNVESENLIDENLNLTTWYRFNNEYSTDITQLTIPASGSISYSVFKITLMEYDANVFYPSQIVNIKGGEEVSATYQYGKQASGLKAGTYRLTLVQQGANIKTTQNPHFWVLVNGTATEDTYNESVREKVTLIGTSTYKFQTNIEIAEDGGTIYGGFAIGYATMPEFNTYITEFSLVRIENDAVVGGNLFTDLNVRDWRNIEGALLGVEKYNATNVSVKNIDLGVADVNGNGKLDIADIRILSKMQDAGIEVTDATNVTTLRNNLLNAVS